MICRDVYRAKGEARPQSPSHKLAEFIELRIEIQHRLLLRFWQQWMHFVECFGGFKVTHEMFSFNLFFLTHFELILNTFLKCFLCNSYRWRFCIVSETLLIILLDQTPRTNELNCSDDFAFHSRYRNVFFSSFLTVFGEKSIPCECGWVWMKCFFYL